MRNALIALLPVVLCNPPIIAKEPHVTPSADTVLAKLRKPHPRLILTDDRVAEIRKTARTDPLLQKCIEDVLRQADRFLKGPKLKYTTRGPGKSRMLRVSRECLKRVYTMGLAWRLTGNDAYAEKVKDNLLTVAEFRDWDPDHFLDTAEMSHAVGIGYDWLYDVLDPEERRKIREGLIRNGMEPGIAAYRGARWGGWSKGSYNWTLVCNGGLIVGCLAIAETDPQYAREILPAAVRSMPRALASYDPDGAWGEGPGYWGYATRYTVVALAALDTALGEDFGLSDRKGLAEAGTFPIYTCGPTNMLFNYADAVEKPFLGRMPVLFWLSRRYKRPEYAAVEREILKRSRAAPEDVIWYQGESKSKLPSRSLDKHFDGRVPVTTFRSAWDDENALFVAAKAGYNLAGHAHLDLGSFVMEALGTRWALDLGRDDYALPGYFDMETRKGKRWTYYRLGSLPHNVPLIDNRNQDPMGTSKVIAFRSSPGEAFVIFDLSLAYKDLDGSVRRGIAMIDDRRAVLVQDEFELAAPHEVAWGLTVDAEVTLDGRTAILHKEGKELRAEIVSPEAAEFTVESAEQKPPQETNKGIRRLMVRLPDRSGKLRVAVLLAPVWDDRGASKVPEITPLEKW